MRQYQRHGFTYFSCISPQTKPVHRSGRINVMVLRTFHAFFLWLNQYTGPKVSTSWFYVLFMHNSSSDQDTKIPVRQNPRHDFRDFSCIFPLTKPVHRCGRINVMVLLTFCAFFLWPRYQDTGPAKSRHDFRYFSCIFPLAKPRYRSGKSYNEIQVPAYVVPCFSVS